MTVIAIIVLTSAVVQLFVAFSNLIFMEQLLEKSDVVEDNLVSVLIPARNEEKNIGRLLVELQRQDYTNLEILVYDDQSDDRTAAIASEMAKYDQRIHLIFGKTLPENWLGKNFACYNLAIQAKGQFFLFLDADVKVNSSLVSKAVKFMKKEKVALLSIFPIQEMISLGEKIIIPLMHNILLRLLPLILVRKSTRFTSLSAANGQFMLFNAEKYKQLRPHEIMRNEKVEDIKIAAYLKKMNEPVSCITGTNDISCRMYENGLQALEGFSKNIDAFFGNSYILSMLFWGINAFGWILTACFSLKFFLIFGLVQIITKVIVSVVSKQNPVINLALGVPQSFGLLLVIIKSIQNKKQNKFEWKGRNIS